MEKDFTQVLSKLAEKYKEVRFLLLFGSRSRGEARVDSDWDLGYLADPNFDSASLYTDLVLTLKTNNVDLVDLSRANGLLRFRAARDGKLLMESSKGAYFKFWFEAVSFWCDAGPLIRKEYATILDNIE